MDAGGSWSGGGNEGSSGFEIGDDFWGPTDFWLHTSGCSKGLNVKNPAEKMCFPCFLDFRFRLDDFAAAATAQNGSLLRISWTEHDLIFRTCLLTEKGRWTWNSPCLSVFTSFRKVGVVELALSVHSIATVAPRHDHIVRIRSLA